MKTYSLRARDIERTWHVLDAADVPLGRLASRAAVLLRGKHKPTFSPHLDMGDFVVVVNAEKVRFSGNEDEKFYYRHSGYPGGLRSRSLRQMRAKHPDRIIEQAVKGMLPHTRLGAQQLRHLKVYAGSQHPHEAQVRAGTGARARQRVEAKAAAPPRAPRKRTATGSAEAAATPTVDEEVATPVDAADATAEKPARATRRKTEATAAAPAADDVKEEIVDSAIAGTEPEAVVEDAKPRRRSSRAKAEADESAAPAAPRRRRTAKAEPAGDDEGKAE